MFIAAVWYVDESAVVCSLQHPGHTRLALKGEHAVAQRPLLLGVLSAPTHALELKAVYRAPHAREVRDERDLVLCAEAPAPPVMRRRADPHKNRPHVCRLEHTSTMRWWPSLLVLVALAAAADALAERGAPSEPLAEYAMPKVISERNMTREQVFHQALRCLRATHAERPVAHADKAGYSKHPGQGRTSSILYATANNLDVGDGSYRGPVRWVLGYVARRLALALDPVQYERPPHTVYDTPRNPLWPDWDFKGDMLNGWEYAMWGGNSTDTRFDLCPIAAADNGDCTKNGACMPNVENTRETADDLLRWLVFDDPPPRLPAASMQATHTNTTVSRTTSDALWVLGEHYLWGTHGGARHVSRAQHYFHELAALGNATAHSRLGFIYGSPLLSPNAAPADRARVRTS